MFWLKQYMLAILIGLVLILATICSGVLIAASLNIAVSEAPPPAPAKLQKINVNIKFKPQRRQVKARRVQENNNQQLKRPASW